MKKQKTQFSFSPPSMLLATFTEDLLLKILDKLTSISDRKTWRLICKDFLWVESLHRKTIRVFRHDSLPNLLRRYDSLELLDLSVCSRLDDAVVAAVFGGDPGWTRRLRSVVLSRATGLRYTGLEAVVRSCPLLEKIDVSYCIWFGDREASALSCAVGLRELNMAKCLGVSDVGLAKIAVGCVGLQRLNLKWCLEITDLGVDLLSKKCADLRALDISYLKVTNKSLRSISSLRKLEDLTTVGCSLVNDDGFWFLGNGELSSLQNVDLSRCSNVSSHGVVSVIKGQKGLRQLNFGQCFHEAAEPHFSKLKDLRSLHSLRLDGVCVSNSILRAIGLNCKNLVEIGLSKCSGITDEGITELVSQCTDLETLDLTCCLLLTDKAAVAIAKYCSKLNCLKLESCDSITEKGLDRIGSCCSFLRELDLTDCGVTDTGLKCLSRCSELIDLKLGLCPNITDKGLFHIGSNFKKLQVLDLYRCTGIGDDGLAAISSGCRKLKKLNLCYCMEITDIGMKYLSSLQELSDLEIRKLVKVSSSGVAAIAMGCKSLVELDMKRCYSINDAGLWALAQYTRNLRQVNISYCAISDMGLCILLGNLKCLQDAKLVHLTHASLKGFELALRASCGKLKKVKLLVSLRHLLSVELLQTLPARGCRVRWVDKPLNLG